MLRFSEEADDKIREECCPGKPFAVYQAEVGVLVLSGDCFLCHSTPFLSQFKVTEFDY